MKLALSSLYFVASAVALGPAGPGYCGESAIHCNLMRVPTSPISAAPNGTLVSGLELANGGCRATLQTAGYTQGFTFANGGVGAFNYCSTLWLNIGTSSSTFKPLSWSTTQITTTWIASYGNYLKAKGASTTAAPYDTFVACSTLTPGPTASPWLLFLLTGNDLPTVDEAGVRFVKCVKTGLFIKVPTPLVTPL